MIHGRGKELHVYHMHIASVVDTGQADKLTRQRLERGDHGRHGIRMVGWRMLWQVDSWTFLFPIFCVLCCV